MMTLTCKPNSQAFLATKPAPSMTLGFEVFVQLVMAAMTTLPCLSSAGCPLNENFATLSCDSFGTAKPCEVIMDVKLRAEINKWRITSHKLLNVKLQTTQGCYLELAGSKSYWIQVTDIHQTIAKKLKILLINSTDNLVFMQLFHLQFKRWR